MAVRRPTKAEIVKIQRLLAGEEIGFSSLSGPVFRELIDKEYIVLDRTGKRKMIAVVKNAEYLMKVLRQKWQINDIQEYIAYLDKEEKDRTDVQLYFMNVYLAATKHFSFGGNEVGVTLAYRHYLRGYNAKWNGLVGGVTFRPAFFPQARVVAEYTGNEFLLGMDVLLWRHLRLQAGVKDFKYMHAGLALQFNLLGQKYRY